MAQALAFICATLILVHHSRCWCSSYGLTRRFRAQQVRIPLSDHLHLGPGHGATFGALPFIYGTVVTSALALLIAVPFGVGAAIFLAELAPPKLSDGMTFLIELLAAVPSVIIGLIGILVLVPAAR